MNSPQLLEPLRRFVRNKHLIMIILAIVTGAAAAPVTMARIIIISCLLRTNRRNGSSNCGLFMLARLLQRHHRNRNSGMDSNA